MALAARACAVVLAVSAALFLLPGISRAQDRVALVIGNGDYRHTSPLRNPVNDARDMADRLEELGFKVIRGKDLDESGMWARIGEFERLAMGAESVLFFYAGHGLQFEGRNYIVPTDAELRKRLDLRSQAIMLDVVLEVMKGRANLVFLDACRNNPLADRLARSFGANRTGTMPRGLAPVETSAVKGLLVSYATAPGDVAKDGSGDNSPYTAALLEHIGTKGQSVVDLMTEVTGTVLRETNNEQHPSYDSSLVEKFSFVPSSESAATSSAAPQSAVTPSAGSGAGAGMGAALLAAERVFWESIMDKRQPSDFEAYLRTFPNGVYADLARDWLRQLTTETGGSRFRRYANTDFRGGDLTQDGHRDLSLVQCEALCARTSKCRGYTYVDDKSWCWPKFDVSEPKSGEQGLTSAEKENPEADSPLHRQPSWCPRATTGTEVAICASPQLSKADITMQVLYSVALSESDGKMRAALRKSQRQWLAERNQCGVEIHCLDNAYAARIATLESS